MYSQGLTKVSASHRWALLFIDNRQFIGILHKQNWAVLTDVNLLGLDETSSGASNSGEIQTCIIFLYCPSPPVSIKLRMLKSRTTYFLLRYRTKCKRLEREAEQGLSAHPQEPLVCDTLYSTSLCVLVLYLVLLQHVLTHFNLCVVFL